ncbi:Uncharacterized protein HZ326_7555 [Fusarium oxysporum f. sp. albedinis]|nr:Uncharacterized protein HZ326_7555 [Fusarium oxysporum f. sp. albedinis]
MRGTSAINAFLAPIFFLQPTSKVFRRPIPRLNHPLRSNCTVTILRRSLQTPDPDEPYLTKGHDVIDMIDQAIKEDGYDRLRDMAMEIGKAWLHKDDASRVRLAAFGCEILLLIEKLNRGGLYDEWLEAIRGQAKRVLEKTEPR